MVRISSPALPPSFPFTLAIVFLETISFLVIQSLIPLLPVLNQDPTDIIEDKEITTVPVTFAILEFFTIIVASIVCDVFLLRQFTAFLLVLLWAPASLLFYLTFSKRVFMNLVRCMAITKGILQPLILSIGTQDYGPEDLSPIYSYFLFNYCAYTAGVLGAQTIVEIDIVENSLCGNMNCVYLAMVVGSAAGLLGAVVSMISINSYATPEPTNFNMSNEILKMFATILGYLPYIVFWVFYQRIAPQLTSLPLLINMYKLDGLDMPIIFMEMKLMFAMIYYIVYMIFYRSFIKHSIWLLTLGGILLGLWPIIAASMVFQHRDQYSTAGPVKPDAIQLIYACKANNPVYLDIPYFINPRCEMPGHGMFTIQKDQILVIRKNNLCPYVIFPTNTINVCLQRGKSYLVFNCNNGAGVTFVDYGYRDTKGGAVVCVVLQNAVNCDKNVANVAFDISRLPTDKQEFVSYTYILYSNNYTSTPAYNSICKIVEPGTYNISQNGLSLSSTYTFEAGGVYYFLSDNATSTWFINAVTPYKSTIWNTPLIMIYLVRAIGEFLVVVNGFYNIFIIVNQNLRTIAICLWLMQIKFGAMIYEIQYHNDIYFQHGDLNKLGGILIAMAILFHLLQYFCYKYKT